MNQKIKLWISGLLMTMTLLANANNETITKSANDLRTYRYKTLDNGLKLLVVSDPKSQRAAAAVDVGVGSSAEPDTFPGLAHFLEHMLFLGTDQYPDTDDYLNYISGHGGNHNAFTAFDHTNYFFDIDPDYLHEGLKRFSRFFVAPLLSEKYVARERHAVDSEYHSKLQEDGWRGLDALKQAVNPLHPYSRFSIGNNATLPQETVRAALVAFYQKYYSSDRMAVIITGKEDAQTLLKWGEALFSEVPKRPPTSLTIDKKLFGGVDLPIEIKNQSVKNEKNLSLSFQLPYLADNEYSKSLHYLAYVLGYEGEGSLLATLKQQGYASGLYTDSGYRIGKETRFEIAVELTEKGYQHIDQTMAIIFHAIDLLKEDKDALRRYQEMATLAQTDFQFKEKHGTIHEVSHLATRLNRYPAKDTLALHAIYSGFNAEQVAAYLTQMTPAHAVVQITAPDITSDKKTPYFEVPFRIETIKPQALTRLADADTAVVQAMHLPKSNAFIADDYSLSTCTICEKTQVLERGIALFFKHDTSFNVPKSMIGVSLQPTAALSLSDKTALALLAALIDEQLTAVLYDADIAGVRVELAAGEKSLSVILEGYQQKMPQLLTLVLNRLRHFDVDSQTFARVKAEYRQNLQNAAKQMPYVQTFSHLNAALLDAYSLSDARLAVLAPIDVATLKKVVDKLLASLAIQMMVYGNNTFDESVAIAGRVADIFQQTQLKNTWQPNKAKLIEKDTETTFQTQHTDSAITYYIQAKKGYPARAAIGLLAKMIEPQFFTQLRTEKQLGYVVFAYPRPTYDQAGIAFTIQSPVANSRELEQHIADFNQHFAEKLATLSEKEFTQTKAILKSELLQQPENLTSAANQYWSDILTTGEAKPSRVAIAKAIDSTQRPDFIRQMQWALGQGKRVVIKAMPKQPPE